MKAYVTYLTTDNYFSGVITLWESLQKTETPYPFYCMVNPKVNDFYINELRKAGVKIIKSQIIKLPENLIEYNKKFCHTDLEVLENYFQKLLVFGLDKFEKIVYLDSDMLVLQNIDDLFDKPHMAGAVDHKDYGRYFINGGLIIIEPGKNVYQELMVFLKNMSEQELYDNANEWHRCFWDTDFYNARYKDWALTDFNQIVDIRYNSFITSFQHYKEVYPDEVKIIHLTGKKPWLMTVSEIHEHILNDTMEAGVFYKKYIEFFLSASKKLVDKRFNEKTELCHIMIEEGSDKSSEKHNYTNFYEKVFRNFKNKDINFFELGIGSIDPNIESNMGENGVVGASLRGWRRYFPNANIFGADIDKKALFEEERIKTFWCDQTNPEVIKNMWLNINEEFDVIIDDGLHTLDANITFFENSIHKLKRSGYYFIEDIGVESEIKEQIKIWKQNYPKLTFTIIDLHEDGFDYFINDSGWYDNRLVMIRYKDLDI